MLCPSYGTIDPRAFVCHWSVLDICLIHRFLFSLRTDSNIHKRQKASRESGGGSVANRNNRNSKNNVKQFGASSAVSSIYSRDQTNCSSPAVVDTIDFLYSDMPTTVDCLNLNHSASSTSPSKCNSIGGGTSESNNLSYSSNSIIRSSCNNGQQVVPNKSLVTTATTSASTCSSTAAAASPAEMEATTSIDVASLLSATNGSAGEDAFEVEQEQIAEQVAQEKEMANEGNEEDSRQHQLVLTSEEETPLVVHLALDNACEANNSSADNGHIGDCGRNNNIDGGADGGGGKQLRSLMLSTGASQLHQHQHVPQQQHQHHFGRHLQNQSHLSSVLSNRCNNSNNIVDSRQQQEGGCVTEVSSLAAASSSPSSPSLSGGTSRDSSYYYSPSVVAQPNQSAVHSLHHQPTSQDLIASSSSATSTRPPPPQVSATNYHQPTQTQTRSSFRLYDSSNSSAPSSSFYFSNSTPNTNRSNFVGNSNSFRQSNLQSSLSHHQQQYHQMPPPLTMAPAASISSSSLSQLMPSSFHYYGSYMPPLYLHLIVQLVSIKANYVYHLTYTITSSLLLLLLCNTPFGLID